MCVFCTGSIGRCEWRKWTRFQPISSGDTRRRTKETSEFSTNFELLRSDKCNYNVLKVEHFLGSSYPIEIVSDAATPRCGVKFCFREIPVSLLRIAGPKPLHNTKSCWMIEWGERVCFVYLVQHRRTSTDVTHSKKNMYSVKLTNLIGNRFLIIYYSRNRPAYWWGGRDSSSS